MIRSEELPTTTPLNDSRRLLLFIVGLSLSLAIGGAVFGVLHVGEVLQVVAGLGAILALTLAGLSYLQVPPSPDGTPSWPRHSRHDSLHLKGPSWGPTAQPTPVEGDAERRTISDGDGYRTEDDAFDTIGAALHGGCHRLREQLASLNRRANLNLVLGMVTTLCGVLVLALSVFHPSVGALGAGQQQPGEPWQPTIYFGARLSLVVLIETFALFFLKLYKETFGETKYFQNELTNLETKYCAARLAQLDASSAVRDKLLLVLANTERNFVLQKGQTTVDLETLKIGRKEQAISALLEKLSAAVTHATKEK